MWGGLLYVWLVLWVGRMSCEAKLTSDCHVTQCCMFVARKPFYYAAWGRRGRISMLLNASYELNFSGAVYRLKRVSVNCFSLSAGAVILHRRVSLLLPMQSV